MVHCIIIYEYIRDIVHVLQDCVLVTTYYGYSVYTCTKHILYVSQWRHPVISSSAYLVIKEVLYYCICGRLNLVSSTKYPLPKEDTAVRSPAFGGIILDIELMRKLVLLNFTVCT